MIDGVPAGHMGPHERRRIRGCFVPEERNGHGAVTTMTLAENAFLSGFIRQALVRFGVIDKKKTLGVRRAHHQGFRRSHHGPESRGSVAVGWQPAEIPGGARGFAGSRACW